MDPSHRGWNSQAGSGPAGSASEQGPSKSSQPSTSYGPPGPQHSPPSTASLPPPNSRYAYQQSSHSMNSLPSINHPSPRQAPSSLHRDQPQQGPGFSLPAISQATGQPGLGERDRDRAREAEQIHIKEEADRHHRELERHRMEQAPQHQAAPGPPIHLHQPVAVGTRTVHGPNGLLAQPGMSGPPQSQHSIGAPNGPGSSFPGGLMQSNGQPQQSQPGLLLPFAPGTQPPQQQMAQGQGQQPILNDALSYLDQVKVQFSDHPDVYNRFLDIMKDFKGGVIDTPGVIGRVSQLFAGNPGLIQGFNTFLPPGYRIECGEGDDPNVIRVTTPAGTSLKSIPGTGRPLSRQDGPDTIRRANGIFTPQPGPGPQIMMSPSGRAVGPVVPPQPYMSAIEHARQQEQQIMHQQEQRGVSHLQNAVSNATAHAGLRAGMSPVPGRATPLAGGDPMAIDGANAQAGLEKRGPVEFNHAISYVNKIKNRFATQPDIYKQFLEILQTYQRESKPIQDVYSQVTHLFKTAPDLLDDFKQFLPETAAQAKAAMQARQQAEENVMMSNLRGDPQYASPVMSREVGMGTPNHARGLPPVGNFAPTPNPKDNKRKRGERQGTAGDTDAFTGPNANKGPLVGPAGKRIKQNHLQTKSVMDQPPTSPTLIPALPSPLPPTSTSAATNEELHFFDRAKKVISNKNTFNEFLKLCNLFSQDLIDRTTLVHRARAFIGGNPDLMKWFQDFVGYDEREILVENKVRIPGGRVSLSNCRGLGPSYRLLPKRERNKVCSGRDELCQSVLNDEWASHPTWASEDSGFIAHKKNSYEEALHRIEEERHDYDFNIETCGRTIQLLEPLAQQLTNLNDQDQRSFQLPTGLGGQSESIWKRIIFKLYGRPKGNEVVNTLLTQPWVVVPVLLNRLRERKETWQLAQREWEKVWRDQTQRMFWKSLDHQHLAARTSDKRAFQIKTIQTEINTRREEHRRKDATEPGYMRLPQLEFAIGDKDVVVDSAHLVLLFIDQSLSTESPQLATWFKEAIVLFFHFDAEWFNNEVNARKALSEAADDNGEDGQSLEDDQSSGRGRKAGARAKGLLRSALDPIRNSASRASTPGAASIADGDATPDVQQDTAVTNGDESTRWLNHPTNNNVYKGRDVDPNEYHQRKAYTTWANLPLYCFIRMFIMLFDRLQKIKQAENACRDAIKNANMSSPAHELGLIDKSPSDFFSNTSANANYYQQMLRKFEGVIDGKVDMLDVEDTLRRYYLTSGYGMYAFEKMVAATARFANSIVSNDGKDRSMDIYQLFKRDAARDTTSPRQQTDYRRAAERIIKDGDLYRIDWEINSNSVKMWLTKKDDPTHINSHTAFDQTHMWRYYIASYTSLAPTEGIEISKLRRVVLPRNLRSMGVNANSSEPVGSPRGSESTEDQVQRRINNAQAQENLILRIAVNSYQPLYQDNTADWWYMTAEERTGGIQGITEATNVLKRRRDYMDDLDASNNAINGMKPEEVAAANDRFSKLVG